MITRTTPVSRSVLAIAAHPDDIESWCGGTLAQSVAAGSTVRLLLVTSGDQGSDDPHATREMVAALREQEARAGAQILGITEVAFLRYGDGEVENTRALRAELVRWLRRWQPNVVFTHDPEAPLPPYLVHHDHRVVGRAVLDAIYPLARDRLAFADLPDVAHLPTHRVHEVWLFASAHADTVVDIQSSFPQKVMARLEHHSQTPDPAALQVAWQERAAQIGAPFQLPCAETFTLLTIESLSVRSTNSGICFGIAASTPFSGDATVPMPSATDMGWRGNQFWVIAEKPASCNQSAILIPIGICGTCAAMQWLDCKD